MENNLGNNIDKPADESIFSEEEFSTEGYEKIFVMQEIYYFFLQLYNYF